MKTYKFKLYESKKNRNLRWQINASGSIYNHCIALHRRYYKIFGKYLNMYQLMKHIAKLRRRIKYWQQVGSQAVQDICQRIDKAYQSFFRQCKSGTRPPNFKKTKKYKSFTLKQAGYKFLEGNRIRIGKKVYKFSKSGATPRLCKALGNAHQESREIKGKIKTLTVKRNKLGELFILVVTDFTDESFGVTTGKIAGFDFGLKTFLTASDLTAIESPLFFNKFRSQLKTASRNLSGKKKGSNNWYKAKNNLNRVYERISHKRKDWFWKLAHDLTDKYDVLIFEDLNLRGMKKLWGRKVSDLSFSTFLEILEMVAHKKGKTIHLVDRFYPSSKTCSDCGYHNKKLTLEDRAWNCPGCGSKLDRDLNAAKNIHGEGASSLTVGDVRHSLSAIAV